MTFIKIPIKKTNSTYYAKLRAEKIDPMKHCLFCGAQLQRRYNPNNERWEDWNSYVKRDYCNASCCQKAISKGKKAEREKEIAKTYKPCKEYQGLFCDMNGNFILNGKVKKVVRPKGKTARIIILCDGKKTYFQASRLIASAWKGATEEDYIGYKDGDIHNICVDNLEVITKGDYYNRNLTRANQARHTNTYEYQVRRLENVLTEAEAVLHYFKTGSMDKINIHVEKYLYNCLCDFCIKSLHYGRLEAKDRVSDAIARFYEVILQGHAVSHPEHYCKMLLQKERKNGWYTHIGDIPKEIKLKIHYKVNLDCLWERYNVKRK